MPVETAINHYSSLAGTARPVIFLTILLIGVHVRASAEVHINTHISCALWRAADALHGVYGMRWFM